MKTDAEGQVKRIANFLGDKAQNLLQSDGVVIFIYNSIIREHMFSKAIFLSLGSSCVITRFFFVSQTLKTILERTSVSSMKRSVNTTLMAVMKETHKY